MRITERQGKTKMKRMTKQEQQLVEDNYHLINSFLNLYELEEIDYYDTVAIALCYAAMTYGKDQGGFDHYAYLCMENAVRVESEEEQSCMEIPQEDLTSCPCMSARQGDFVSFAFIEDIAVFRYNFSVFVKQLNQKTKKVVQMFVYGYKQAEIADALGCTQSCVSRVRKKLAGEWQRCIEDRVRRYEQPF